MAKKNVKKVAAGKKPVAKKSVKAAKKPVKPAKAAVKKPVKKIDLAAIELPTTPTRRGRKLKPGKKTDRSGLNRVAPKIVTRKPTAAAKPKVVAPVVDTAAAVSLAQSIAEEMKRASRAAETAAADADAVRLSRRPTTRAQGRSTEKFPATDLKEFRKRLIEAREKAESGISAMKSTGFNEADDREADGGDGTNQTLRLQALGQMGTINRTIQQIEEALHRIDEGTYGVCKVCGQLIRKPRLLNQPFVLTCMECQSEMEKSIGR